MSKITIEHNPSQQRLQELGVAGWEIWEKEPSTFEIDFDETETAYVLEGEIIVTPADGEPVRIVPGDLVSFHAGLESDWQVVKPLKKHYSYDFPDGV
ncbi:MAG: cupin domain-containing protein [Methylotetracoccus sp.]